VVIVDRAAVGAIITPVAGSRQRRRCRRQMPERHDLLIIFSVVA